jgi:hypothetical protein
MDISGYHILKFSVKGSRSRAHDPEFCKNTLTNPDLGRCDNLNISIASICRYNRIISYSLINQYICVTPRRPSLSNTTDFSV